MGLEKLLDTDTLDDVAKALHAVADDPNNLNDWLIFHSLDTRPTAAEVLHAAAEDFEVMSAAIKSKSGITPGLLSAKNRNASTD